MHFATAFRLGGDATPDHASLMAELPERKRLHHAVPAWVPRGATFFVTINAKARGTDVLTAGIIAERLLESAALYHERGIWWLHVMLVMPDHLHALLAIAPDRDLAKTLTAWKSYQTKSLRIEWQAGFFDHRLRHDESFEEKANYIRMNPVRAQLVTRPEDWPHVWAPNSR